jgi:EmrB/QacA subfamily drug resistance transporter
MRDFDIRPIRPNIDQPPTRNKKADKKAAKLASKSVKPDESKVAASAVAPSVPAAPTTRRGNIRKWASLLVLGLALAIIIIDTTLLNVSLRTIIADLHTDIKGLQWVITAYALVLGALTITGGRLGDLFGRKKMFVAGAIIFAIGSFVASISTHLGVLVAGEAIIEGIGAALMMPATASLLVATFHGRERAIAFGVWGSIAGASSAIGPILGGYLTSHYSWRWGFRINVVVAAALVIGSLLIRESRDEQERPQLDLMGVLLSATGLLTLVFGIIQSSTYGWWITKAPYAVFGHTLSDKISITAISGGAGVVLLILFVFWELLRERRGKTPLVSMRLFANKQFTAGVLTMALLSLAMVGLIFVMPVFLQSVKGLDAFHTGLTLLPLSIAILIVGPLSGALSHKIPAKYLVQLGLLVITGAIYVLYRSLSIDATSASLAPAFALYGIGMGLVMANVSNITLSAVSIQQSGEASGVNNTLRQVGSSFGSAILGAVLLTAITTNVTNGINDSGKIPAQLKPQLSQSIGANASNAAFGGAESASSSHLPPSIAADIDHIAKQASTDAAKTTTLYGIPFAILALLVSTQLPGRANVETEKSAAAAH